jgi:hypothetical protein
VSIRSTSGRRFHEPKEKIMEALTIDDVSLAPVVSSTTVSRRTVWLGRILAGLPLAFLTFDAALKLLAVPQVIEASAKLGFGASTLPLLGTVELLGVLLTLARRSRVFGAVLLSAYLGGAVCIHVQHSDPLFSHTLFPIYFAAMIWSGFALIDARVRALSPFARG